MAATVLSITHVNSLKVESECSAPGEQPKFLGIREQRVTGLMSFVLMGCSVFLTSVLKVRGKRKTPTNHELSGGCRKIVSSLQARVVVERRRRRCQTLGLEAWWEPALVLLPSPSAPAWCARGRPAHSCLHLQVSFRPIRLDGLQLSVFRAVHLLSLGQAALYPLPFAPPSASEEPFSAAKEAAIIPVGFLARSSLKVISSLGSKEARHVCVLPQEYVEMLFCRHRTRHTVAWVQCLIFLQPKPKVQLKAEHYRTRSHKISPGSNLTHL